MPVIRPQTAVALSGPTVRSIRWQPVLGAAGAAAALMFLTTRTRMVFGAPVPDVGERVLWLRLAALLLAMGAAFLLDDPSEESTRHVPTTVLARRLLRVTIALPVLAVVWAALLWIALHASIVEQPFPVAAVTLEAAGLVALGLAAAVGLRAFVPERLGGVAAAPALLVLVGIAYSLQYLPGHLLLFPLDPADRVAWRHAHDLWRLVALGALLALVALSLDPGRRGIRRLRRAPAGRHRLVRGRAA